MAVFDFRLQRVLEVKEKIEKKKELELAAVQKEYDRKEKLIGELEARNRSCMNHIKEKMERDLNPQKIMLSLGYTVHLKKKITAENKKKDHINESVQKHLSELVEARREKKIMERFRDNEFISYRKEERRRKMKALDQFAANQYTRKQMGLKDGDD